MAEIPLLSARYGVSMLFASRSMLTTSRDSHPAACTLFQCFLPMAATMYAISFSLLASPKMASMPLSPRFFIRGALSAVGDNSSGDSNAVNGRSHPRTLPHVASYQLSCAP